MKMKNRNALSVLVIIMAVLNSCTKVEGTGPVVRQTINTADFEMLVQEVPATLFYTPSSTFKVEVEAQQNIINLIKTEVVNNTIFFSVKNNANIRTRENIKIHVQAPDLSHLQLAGNGNIVVMTPYRPDVLYVGISGNGNIAIPFLEANRLLADINGSGNISIENGVALKADIDITGSGLADWENLSTDSLTSRISGSATIRVFANDYIKTVITGSGTLYYKGNPVIESQVSGTGKIIKL
ncbi:head GIN domain-containing protein [Pollutibacter soli]|uniref:head GIN domain-containing protein n=1 Tax=Pollutibacter soli TaxID=3034157 RepID=UPI003013675C